jgi:adenine-specific DNA-methyltransferase
MNEVFVLRESEASLRGLSKMVKPLVSRSGHLKGIIFNKHDWRANANAGVPVHLLDLPSRPKSELPQNAQQYLTEAEEKGLHRGYKCRIRKFWHVVPSVYAPDAFLLRQIHSYPKLIVNESGATCTDTIHRVRFKNGTNRRLFAAAFLNSLTFAFAEVLGRSYGGGVLELEPSEADRLPIPLIGSEHLDPMEIDSLIRDGQIRQVLMLTDDVLLRKGLGLQRSEVRILNDIWLKLQMRRIGRKEKDVRPCEAADLRSEQGRLYLSDAKTVLDEDVILALE